MKTEEDIAREKEAIASMKGAKSSMELALSRNTRLEMALAALIGDIETLKRALGDSAYLPVIENGSRVIKPIHAFVDEATKKARSVL